MTMLLAPEGATLSDVVGVEDAEALLEWCTATAVRRVDLTHCTYLHAANLQVLLAAAVRIDSMPEDPILAAWLRRAFPHTSDTDR